MRNKVALAWDPGEREKPPLSFIPRCNSPTIQSENLSLSTMSGCDFFFGGISCSATWAIPISRPPRWSRPKAPIRRGSDPPLAVSSSWQSKQWFSRKPCRQVLEVATDGFAGCTYRFRSLRRGSEQDEDRHPEGEGQLGHAKISFRGPVPESNLAANCSDILNRSHSTPGSPENGCIKGIDRTLAIQLSEASGLEGAATITQ